MSFIKHQLVKDCSGNNYSPKDDLFLLKELTSNKKLYTFYDELVTIVKGFKRGETYIEPYFRTLNNELIENGVKYIITEPMTKEHRELQENLLYYLKENLINCELEKRFPEINRIADVYFELKKEKYVIEIQRSRYTAKKYIDRTQDFKSIGVNIIWVCIVSDLDNILERGFDNSIVCNGGYLLFVEKEKLNIFNIKKYYQDNIIYNKKKDLDSFISFLYDKYEGVNLNLEIKNKEYKIKKLDYSLITLISDLEEKRIDLESRQNRIKELIQKEKNYNERIEGLNLKEKELMSEILKKEKDLYKPKLKIEELNDKIILLKEDSLNCFKELNNYKKEIQDYKNLRDKIKISKEILYLLEKEGYYREWKKGELGEIIF